MHSQCLCLCGGKTVLRKAACLIQKSLDFVYMYQLTHCTFQFDTYNTRNIWSSKIRQELSQKGRKITVDLGHANYSTATYSEGPGFNPQLGPNVTSIDNNTMIDIMLACMKKATKICCSKFSFHCTNNSNSL